VKEQPERNYCQGSQDCADQSPWNGSLWRIHLSKFCPGLIFASRGILLSRFNFFSKHTKIMASSDQLPSTNDIYPQLSRSDEHPTLPSGQLPLFIRCLAGCGTVSFAVFSVVMPCVLLFVGAVVNVAVFNLVINQSFNPFGSGSVWSWLAYMISTLILTIATVAALAVWSLRVHLLKEIENAQPTQSLSTDQFARLPEGVAETSLPSHFLRKLPEGDFVRMRLRAGYCSEAICMAVWFALAGAAFVVYYYLERLVGLEDLGKHLLAVLFERHFVPRTVV
jgi:hypothetical protein